MLTSLKLWARRQAWLLPSWAKRLGKRLVGRVAAKFGGIDGWSAPLVARDPAAPAADMPTASAADAPSPAAPPDRIQPLPARDRGIASRGRVRCCVVTPVLDAGGIDEFVAFLARNLPLQGLDTCVLCTWPSRKERARVGILAAALRREGAVVAEASPVDGRGWLADNRPDVISAHAPPGWVLEAAGALQVPVVETLHAVPTPIGTDWKGEPVRSRHITTFVAVSELVRRQYLRGNPGFAAGAVVTIPNAFNEVARPAVDRAKARAWLGLGQEFLFVSLARHVLQKNAYGLVAAFADVAWDNPSAHLVIAGRVDDPLYTEEVRRLRDRLPVRARVHLRENLSNPSALLAAADGFVLNSFFEGWPLASMEALAAGLPVVMSDVGGAREQIGNDGTRGYLVPNPLGNPEYASWEAAGRERFRPQANKDALVAALNAVIRDREQWADARLDLAAASKQRFSARACAEQHAEVLRRAAGSAEASAPHILERVANGGGWAGVGILARRRERDAAEGRDADNAADR